MSAASGLRIVGAGDDTVFRALKDAVIARTGHFYYIDKDALLRERIEKRCRSVGARDAADYLRLLGSEEGEAEWNALEAEITIGETFFFRFAEQFDALRAHILPDIIARNRESRRIRIWSAGCSTGAEAYSIAILLRELLGEDIASWNVGVVGTDINDGFLTQARRATYGRWTLRATPDHERARWFTTPGPAGPWTLRPAYRGLAHFERHNLMSLLDGASPLQFTGFDLILCRNVLIYFHTEAAHRIVEALGRCLDPRGWLLVGHAEGNLQSTPGLAPVEVAGVVAYRPGEPLAAPEAGPAPTPWAPHVHADVHADVQTRAPTQATPRARSKPPRPAPATPPPAPQHLAPTAPLDARDALARLRVHADTGDFAAAADVARAILHADPTAAVAHYYEGVMARAQDRTDVAEKAFRRALYCDGGFVMAHYQLGLLLLALGRAADARRSLANAARAAAAAPADARLPEGDDLTAGALRGLARAHLTALEGR